MAEKRSRYRIDEAQLHTKKLGKHTLTDVIVTGRYSAEGYAGVFYHYTSPEGLRGILQSRILHFTDCEYLNDYKERININNDLDEFWANHKGEYDKDFYILIKGYHLSQYEDNYYSYMESDRSYGMSNEPARYFIFSASESQDSLSMWKYYSKSGSYDGYCIGLVTYALGDEWIDRDTGVAVEEGLVIYNKQKKQEIIQSAIEKLYEKWCTYRVSEEFNAKIRRDYESWVAITSLFFKDACFEDEKEYRFVAIAPTSKLNELQYDYDGQSHKMYDFRVSNGLFIPYIRMPFFYWNKDCWAVNSIGIAPSINGNQKKESVNRYIKFLDYKFPDLHVYNSSIPLRY